MSLFGSLMGEMDDDPIFGMHMRSVRQMNNMMNSMFANPFGMFGGFGAPCLTAAPTHNSLMPFGFPPMNNMNRLLGGSLDSFGDCHSYSSTSVVSMSSGPDGKPMVYRASSSTRTGPGGLKETQRSVSDSASGTKKLAIGHHIGDRAHIVEREQNLQTGDQEERQDFINLDEEEADDFNREWESRARPRSSADMSHRITMGGSTSARPRPHSLLAITSGNQNRRSRSRQSPSSRRGLRSPALAMPSSTSSASAAAAAAAASSSSSRHPYGSPGHSQPRRQRNMKSASGSPNV